MDISPTIAVVVGVAAFASAVLGGVAGIGAAIALIPVLTFVFGIHQAIPILAVATLLNTTSRWWANRRYVDYRVALWFSLGAVPMAIIGGTVFANAPADLLARGLGVFLVALVLYRHLPIGQGSRLGLRGFPLVGGIQGFLSGLFGGAGPFGAHFLLAYGLRKNAFVGTMAVGMLATTIAKSTAYARFALMGSRTLLTGAAIGLVMVVGTYVGGMLIKRMPERVFVHIVEAVMIVSAVLLIVQG